MKCMNCGFEQENGKFCGQCGGQLSIANPEDLSSGQDVVSHDTEHGVRDHDEQAAGAERLQQENAFQGSSEDSKNDAMDKVKQTSKAYGAYFGKYLKQPSLIFSERKASFNHGLISIAIVAVLIALATSLLIRNLVGFSYSDFGGIFSSSYYTGPSAFSIFFYALIFVLISMAIILFFLFVVNQFFGTAYSFKEMISVYGAHLVPAIILAVIAFLLILLKSYTIGSYLLLIVFGLVVTTFPIYLISSLLTQRSKNLDPLYGYLIYLVLVGIAFIIFTVILMDSTFGRMLDEISYF